MGVVYKARDLRLKRLVALKMILEAGHAGPTHLARFRAEAEAAARLRHPNIVQVYEVGEHDGLPYLALEYVEGGTLTRRLDSTLLPAREAAELVEVLARAMDFAHRRGIVHRDLKPGNILVEKEDAKDGTDTVADDSRQTSAAPALKITDFGLAKRLDDDSNQTRSGALLGTPAYMAPEQAEGRNRDVGPAADIYALGTILYELLTGQTPFEGPPPVVLFNVLHTDPPSPRRINPRIPTDAETICLKCLQKEPARRYPTAGDLAEDPRRFRAGEPVLARPVGLVERGVKLARRRPLVTALAGGMFALALVSFLLIAWQWRRAEDKAQAETAARGQAEQERRKAQRQSSNLALEQGQRLCEEGDVGRGILWLARSLELAPPEDKDLQRVARTNLAFWGPCVRLRACLDSGHLAQSMAVRPDGKVVLTACLDGTVEFWDAAEGNRLAELDTKQWGLRSAVFSRDGSVFMTVGPLDGSGFKTVGWVQVARVWDSATRRPLGPLIHPQGGINTAALRPDGRAVLTLNGEGQARLWDAATGKEVIEPLDCGYSESALFDPQGKQVLLGRNGQASQWWDLASRKRALQIFEGSGGRRGLAVSADGRFFATGGEDQTARVWGRDGKALGPPLAHDGEVQSVAISPDASTLLTGSEDGSARLWDVLTGKPLGFRYTHNGPVRAVAFLQDATGVATLADDGVVRLFDLAPVDRPLFRWTTGTQRDGSPPRWAPANVLGTPPPTSMKVAFSPHSKQALTADYPSNVALWDVATARLLFRESFGGGSGVTATAFSPDGKRFFVSSYDPEAYLAEVPTGRPIGKPMRGPRYIQGGAFSPDGKVLALGGYVGLTMWDAATAERRPTQPQGEGADSIAALAFGPDGRTVVTGGPDCCAHLWDVATGRLKGPPLVHESSVEAVAFSPDGKVVATGSADRTARVWDAATGQPVSPWLRHEGAVSAVAFSPDGRTLATASSDRTVRRWDARTGERAGPALPHGGPVTSVAFGPDGRTVLTRGRDGKAWLWDLASGKTLAGFFLPQEAVLAAAISPDGGSVLTGSDTGASLWSVPKPVEGDADQIVLWSQAVTGMVLNDDGTARLMDGKEWQALRQRLGEVTGPPWRRVGPAGNGAPRS